MTDALERHFVGFPSIGFRKNPPRNLVHTFLPSRTRCYFGKSMVPNLFGEIMGTWDVRGRLSARRERNVGEIFNLPHVQQISPRLFSFLSCLISHFRT